MNLNKIGMEELEKSVKSRIIEFYTTQGLSKREFECSIGVSNGYIDKLRNCPKPDKLERIYLTYPNLNKVWLLTGDGEMLINECEETTPLTNYEKVLLKAMDEISEQRKLTEKSQEQISRFQDQLDRLIGIIESSQKSGSWSATEKDTTSSNAM